MHKKFLPLIVILLSGMVWGLMSKDTTQAAPHTMRLHTKVAVNGLTDLRVTALEVTQAVQSFAGTTRLVAGKETYVRLHVTSLNDTHNAFAYLRLERNSVVQYIAPANSTGWTIDVKQSPNRAAINDAYLFKLPTFFTYGNVSIEGVVNPTGQLPPELFTFNNRMTRNYSFETMPSMQLVLYMIGYTHEDTLYYPRWIDVTNLKSWLERAYPIRQLNLTVRSAYVGETTYIDTDDGPVLSNPTCGKVNNMLTVFKTLDMVFNPGQYSPNARYYALVHNGGVFMRGCSPGSTRKVGSGPTGSSSWGWDYDGSYGDWYGGHELGHAYGRPHAPYCGADGSAYYPYSGGFISNQAYSDYSLYTRFGFDIETLDIYPSWWRDVMSYCDNQWVSEYTYEKLMDKMQNEAGNLRIEPTLGLTPTNRLLIAGSFTHNEAGMPTNINVQPPIQIPDAPELYVRQEGDYAIVLRDAAGAELARYPFALDDEEHHDDMPNEDPDMPNIDRTEAHVMYFTQMVPHERGTTSFDILTPDGSIIYTLSAGDNTPTVSSIQVGDPDPQVVLGASGTLTQVNVYWTGDDSDGDDVFYTVQFSPDAGNTWNTLLVNTTETFAPIARENFMGTDNGLVRIIATDGINTSFTEDDILVSIPNMPPEINIEKPETGATYAMTQTVSLSGSAYDTDDGSLDEEMVWTSDRDGVIGTGAMVALAGDLSVGTHQISVAVTDTMGAMASDSIMLTIVAELEELPPVPDYLRVSHSAGLIFDVRYGMTSIELDISNDNLDSTIQWQVDSDHADWLILESTSGMTPDSLLVRIDSTGLEEGGYYTDTLTFSSPDIAGLEVEIPVRVVVSPYNVYLPFIGRP